MAEDEWLMGMFPDDYKGYAVEVGAFDGLSSSNTLLLENSGWTVLCIEPNPRLEADLRSNRKLVKTCACDSTPGHATFYIHRLERGGGLSSLRPAYIGLDYIGLDADALMALGFDEVVVEVETLDRCLEGLGWDGVDVVSIDTEGTELDVLKGLDLKRWHPKAMIVENWCDPSPVTEYLKSFGYFRVDRRNVNDLYVMEAK